MPCGLRSRPDGNFTAAMATDVQDEAAADTKTSGRIRPHQLTLGLGIVAAAATFLAWLVPSISPFHNETPDSRDVFTNIPDAFRGAFYAVTVVLILWGAWNFSLRVRNWERGQPDKRETNRHTIHRRRSDFMRGVYMRT